MIFSKIWQRYIFEHFFKFVLFFLVCFYFLYVVIDFSINLTDLVHLKKIGFLNVLKYYGFQFIKRADILFPLATLIGAIKVLSELNVNKELLAFQSAGIHLKRLLQPLFFLSVVFCLFNLAVNEYIAPGSLRFIDKFYDAHIGHSYRTSKSIPLHVLHLDDHSKIVYQYYDAAKEAFFDVIWIKNGDDLWRMKYLKADPENPHGEFVDHLVRGTSGGFEKVASYHDHVFVGLSWSKDLPTRGYIPHENQSITQLWKILSKNPDLTRYESQEILTQLLFKISMPFLCLLTLIAVTPFCLKPSRLLPQFFIYSLSIFGFIAFIALMDAMVILGESDTLSPYVAILAPIFICFGFFSWRFARKA